MRRAVCSEVGNYDRVVIQEILKEIAQTQQVDLNAKQRFKGASPPPPFMPSLSSILKVTMLFDAIEYMYTYTVVIIHEADSLTRDAQAALRRTMEKYMSNMRIILCANSTSKLIAPIKSRCLLVRVAAPTEDEVCSSRLSSRLLVADHFDFDGVRW